MSTDNKQATGRAPQRFLALLRDVLFESTPEQAGTPPSANAASPQSVVPTASGDPDTEAARAALCQSLDEQAGAALREFTLQIEGLRDVIGDAAARRRAALRVLSLKGISVQALVLELERLLATLDAQRETFAGKVETRRAAIERQRSDAAATLARETAEAEAAVQRLQAELDAERTKITDANARRDRQVVECDENSAELAAKEHGFEHAFAELRAEYGALKSALVNPESS
jgi:chromosome segregation ATPase